MKFQYIPYLIPLFISFLIVTSLAIYANRNRSVRGAKAFIISMLIGSLWTLANALEMAGLDFGTKIFWANVQYIAYAFAPVAWLVMVLQFTDRENWVTKRNILIMSIIPVITIILAWTDPLHGLVRYNLALDTSGAFPVISKEYGTWFMIHYIYCYLLNFSAITFLFRTVLLKNTIYQKQAFYLLLGFSFLTLSNLLYVVGLSPFEGFDISPIIFSLTGIVIGWGIFHFRLFDLVPIARETVIEKMGSGIIVIDKRKRIIDINPQARKMLDLSNKVGIALSLSNVSPQLHELIDLKDQDSSNQKEFTLDYNGENHYFELYLSPIKDYRKELTAWVLILNDISDLKLAREQINLQQQEMAIMDERERMSRDLHDNLGQILSFSTIQIQAIRQELKKDNQQLADQYLQRLNGIIKDAHKDIREFVYNIRDNSYYKKDFISLLKDEIKGFKENSDLKVELLIDEDNSLEVLGTEEKVQLINIVKEAFTNILKHAEADIVRISLSIKGELGELIVEDNGKGIDESSNRGSGINIMNERARLIAGKLKVDSQSGRGTKIIVAFPV